MERRLDRRARARRPLRAERVRCPRGDGPRDPHRGPVRARATPARAHVELRGLSRRACEGGRASARAVRPASRAGARADVQRVRPAPRGSRGCGRAARVRARGRRTGARAEGGASCRCRTHRSPSGSPGPPRHAPHLPVRERAVDQAARRPLRALQPEHALRLGRRGGLAGIATGDFHRPEHLATWKTLLPCAKDERAVVEYLRWACRRSSHRSERRNELPLSRACERRRRGSAAGCRRGTGAEHARSVVAGDLCLDVPLGATAPDVLHVDASEASEARRRACRDAGETTRRRRPRSPTSRRPSGSGRTVVRSSISVVSPWGRDSNGRRLVCHAWSTASPNDHRPFTSS